MRGKLFVILVLALFVVGVSSCGKKGEEKKEEGKKTEQVKKKGEEEAAPADEKTEKKAEEEKAEEKPAEEAAPAEEKAKEKPAEGAAPAEEKAEEKPAEEAAPAEEKAEKKPAEAAAAGGSPCDKYAKCCNDYADALGKVQGVPAQAVEATKQGCAQVEQLKTMGAAADQACQQALDAMGQAAAAYKGRPGFEWPASCN